MTGQNVTPNIMTRLGASNSQAVRMSCCCKVSRLLIVFIAIIENMSGFARKCKSTHYLVDINYLPASSTHLAAAASNASFGDFTPVNAS